MSDRLREPSEAEKIDWLRLYRSEGVGSATFFGLIEHFGTAARALEALPDLAKRGGAKRSIKVPLRAAAERELEALAKLGGRLLLAKDPAFPVPLRTLDTVPFLMALGRAELLTHPTIAVVGSRNASAGGRRLAQTIATDLGRAGLVVASGMARGIDGAAHEGALATGTIAVLAGGVDNVYPPEHKALYRRIIEEGCVVSEMPPGTVPQASHFPRRNRIISGLSLGVVVVEAAPRSGSLITARLALEQGREVFAVPGSPLDPRSQGPNGLIRQGAVLTESAADVIDGLGAGWQTQATVIADEKEILPVAAANDDAVDEARRQVADALSATPVPVDEIIRQCQFSPAIVSVALLELELAGRVTRHPGGKVAKIF